MNASSPLAATGSPPDAVVVGAGLSGLLTAHLLEQAGLDVCLVEARDRVGGRILGIPATVGATTVAHRHDLGPAWVWPDINPRLAHWLQAVRLYDRQAEITTARTAGTGPDILDIVSPILVG